SGRNGHHHLGHTGSCGSDSDPWKHINHRKITTHFFIVDGIPIDNSGGEQTRSLENSNRALDINPNDIAEINILKGPAATALYGIRAANGAVLITTKKGSNTDGKVQVEFNSSFSIDQVNKLPEKQNLYAGGRNGVFQPYELRSDGNLSRSWGPRYGTVVTDPDGSSFMLQPYDNASAFFRNAQGYDNHLNLYGGNEKSNFYMSTGHSYAQGVIPNSNYERYTAKLSGSVKPRKNLTFSGSMNYTYSEFVRLRKGGNWSAPMVSLFRGPDDFDNTGGYADPVNTEAAYFRDDTLAQRKGSVFDNPFFSVNENPATTYTDRWWATCKRFIPR
ncbi:MAG: TonB-dependent receptor plug domain-containing protein, partial [Cytophagales bacterium]|nr:TonB-dependent receptor plug domain-containing protein [Cytophagales bacterium]